MLEFTGKVINGQISWATEANWIWELSSSTQGSGDCGAWSGGRGGGAG